MELISYATISRGRKTSVPVRNSAWYSCLYDTRKWGLTSWDDRHIILTVHYTQVLRYWEQGLQLSQKTSRRRRLKGDGGWPTLGEMSGVLSVRAVSCKVYNQKKWAMPKMSDSFVALRTWIPHWYSMLVQTLTYTSVKRVRGVHTCMCIESSV